MKRLLLVLLVGILIVHSGFAAGSSAPENKASDYEKVGVENSPNPSDSPHDERLRTSQVAEPETADEFLTAFGELESSPALVEYNSFGIVHTQAVISLQADTFNETVRERMWLLLLSLRNFDAAYASIQNGSLRDAHVMANRTRTNLTRLRESGGTTYATLAEIGLDRFYQDLGDQFHNRSQEVDNTPQELQLLNEAAEAYRSGGAADQFAQMVTLREVRAAEFQQDRNEMNASQMAATAFLNRCDAGCATPSSAITEHRLDIFNLYKAGLQAQNAISEAERITRDHGLTDRRARISAVRNRVDASTFNLIGAIGIVTAGYSLMIGLPAMFLWTRLLSWAHDIKGEQVGSQLTAIPATEVSDGTD